MNNKLSKKYYEYLMNVRGTSLHELIKSDASYKKKFLNAIKKCQSGSLNDVIKELTGSSDLSEFENCDIKSFIDAKLK